MPSWNQERSVHKRQNPGVHVITVSVKRELGYGLCPRENPSPFSTEASGRFAATVVH